MDPMPGALEAELAAYRDLLSSWTEHEGKFVLIHGKDVVDFFAPYEDAIKVGYQRFGLDPFLVKQVNRLERAQFIRHETRKAG
jgi:hypothetical protein